MTALLVLAAVATCLAPVTPRNDSLAITVRGTGKPVVFLPGLLGSGYGFRNVVSLLDENEFQSIIVEPLGFGSSEMPLDADYSLAAQADRVVEALDDLADGPAWVVAHSVGAAIAYRMAYRHPDRIAGIISIEGGPAEAMITPGVRMALRFSTVIRTMGPRAVVEILRRQMRNASAGEGWLTDEVIDRYSRPYQTRLGETLQGLRAMSRAEEPEMLRDHLSEIRCPVVLLLGSVEHGARPNQEAVSLMSERIGDLRIETVSHAGHFLHEENPEAVAAAIRRLTGEAGAVAR